MSSPSPRDGDALKCPACGEANPVDFKFCWSCSGSLEDAVRVEDPSTTAGEEPGEPRVSPIASQSILETVDPTLASVDANESRRRWLELIAVVLMFEVSELLSMVAHGVGAHAVDPLGQLRDLVWLVGASLLVVVLMRADRVTLHTFGLRRERPWVLVAWSLGVTVAGVIVMWMAMVWSTMLGLPADEVGEFTKPGVLEPLVLMAGASFEEIYYRAYLWNRLLSLKAPPWLAILICVAVFTVGHGYGVSGSLSVALYGLFLALAFWVRRSVWPLIVGHWLLNMLITYADLLPITE